MPNNECDPVGDVIRSHEWLVGIREISLEKVIESFGNSRMTENNDCLVLTKSLLFQIHDLCLFKCPYNK